MNHLSESMKEVVDWGAFSSIVATVMQLIPDVSGVVGLVWLVIRVWETDTVKGWRGKGKKDGDK